MMDEVFEQAGFTGKYRTETEDFYRQFFHSTEEMLDFFLAVFKANRADNRPRQMMNQICRFISLANDIEVIRPGRDPLRILFLRICLESLCALSCEKSKGTFFKKFEKCISPEGQQYILNHFSLSYIEPGYALDKQKQLLFNDCSRYTLTIQDFFDMIRCVRNTVVHDGDYWSMQLFARDSESIWLVHMTTDEKIISCYQPTKGEQITYHFETTLIYERFIFYFTAGCIQYLKNYLVEREQVVLGT